MHVSLLDKTINEMTMQIIKSKSWPATGNQFCCKILLYLFHLPAPQSRSLSTQLSGKSSGKVKGKEKLPPVQLPARNTVRWVAHVYHHILSSRLCFYSLIDMCCYKRKRPTYFSVVLIDFTTLTVLPPQK